jgi:hypothetical protein
LADPVPAAARPLVGNGNVILRELSPPCSYPPQQAPLPHPKSLPISSHGPAGHWGSPDPPPVMDSAVSREIKVLIHTLPLQVCIFTLNYHAHAFFANLHSRVLMHTLSLQVCIFTSSYHAHAFFASLHSRVVMHTLSLQVCTLTSRVF